ncbi:MAG: hypothetical protein AB8F94_24165 [Saprospiraceae bacterium]
MKNNDLEKNIKDQLKSYENFDGNKMSMWDEIEQELDQDKKRGFFWIWFGAGVLLIGLVATWIFFDDKKDVEITEHKISQQSNYKNNKVVKTIDSLVTEPSVAKDFFPKSELNISHESNQITNSFSQKNIKNDPSNIPPNNTITNNIFNKNQKEESENVTIATGSGESNRNKTETTTRIKLKYEVVFLPNLFLQLAEKNNEVVTLDSIFHFKPNPKDSTDYKWGLSIAGGINSHTTGYNNTSTFSNLRKNHERSLFGWNIQLELERRFPKDFFITSGIRFNRNWIEFKYESTTQEIQYLENVVIGFDLDLAVGDTTFYYGDTSITTITTREIKHHNRYDKLKVPILFGKKWSKGKFTYGGFVGASLDIWLRQKGRNLSPDEFVFTYDSKNTDEPNSFPKLGFNADFRGEVNYQIGKQHHLFFQPNLSFSLSNWSNSDFGIVQKPITFGVNLGYQFRF